MMDHNATDATLDQHIHEEQNVWSQQSPQHQSFLLDDVETDTSSIWTESDVSITSIATPIARRSRFIEGSMNKMSRALASTWSNISVTSTNSVAGTTERGGADSKFDGFDSSSSVDIAEFNPSSTEPTTIKQTIKRLTCRPATAARSQANKTSANSTIKVRSSNASSKFNTMLRRPTTRTRACQRDNRPIPSVYRSQTDNKPDAKGPQVAAKIHVLDRLRPRKSTARLEDSRSAEATTNLILEERKTRAAVAYAEQFGTVKRKTNTSKIVSLPPSPRDEIGDNPQGELRDPTSKPREVHLRDGFSTVRKIFTRKMTKSGVREHSNDASAATVSAAPPIVDPASMAEEQPASSHIHPLFPSTESLRQTVPDEQGHATTTVPLPTIIRLPAVPQSVPAIRTIDTSKRPNMSQLEKENRQLRAMLRQKDTVETRSVVSSDVSRKRKNNDNWAVHEDATDEDEQEVAIPVRHIGGRGALRPLRSNPWRQPESVPPVPPLPSDVKSRKNYAADTDTCKRRRVTQVRSLSAVLESPEGEAENQVDHGVRPAWVWDEDVF